MQPEYNIDYIELVTTGSTVWHTKERGDLSITFRYNNVATLKVIDSKDISGSCSTFDIDGYGIATCLMSAIRTYLKDVSETFINFGK